MKRVPNRSSKPQALRYPTRARTLATKRWTMAESSALTRNDPTLLAKSDPAPRRSGGAFAAGQEVFLPANNSRAKPGPPHSGG